MALIAHLFWFILVTAAVATHSSENPVRRVVTMLQTMQQKVMEEGKRDAAIHEKYMCYCSSDSLEKAMAEADKKLPELQSNIGEFSAEVEQLKTEIKQHKKVRTDAEQAIEEAAAIRQKDAAAFTRESTDKKKDIAAMGKAIKALEKGGNYEFLQTESAAAVQRIAANMELSTNQRELLDEFFGHQQQDSTSDGDTPASGQIVGLLKQMKSDMEKELVDLTASEAGAVADYNSLTGSKQKEVAAATATIQQKQTRLADTDVQLQAMKEEYDDTEASQEQDKKFFADKDANCAKAVKDYEIVKKTRAEELSALAETIKLLNDDDALELFKKTLPSPSLLQLTIAASEMRQQALKVLHGVKHHHDPRLDFIALALHGKKVSFEKVLKMIDDMVKLLDKEQKDDDTKQEVCVEDLDKTEDKLKGIEASVKNVGKVIAEDKNLMETAEDEIKAKKKGIEQLDKKVIDATETRKEEHDAYEATLAENKAAKDLLLLAENQLNKFYHPQIYREPPQSMLQEPPKTVAPYKAKNLEKNGVMEMLGTILSDLDKQIAEQEVAEKDAQTDYENFIEDSAAKRTKDVESISQKERTKAELESELAKLTAKDKAKLREAYATTGVLGDIHKECDWLLSNYEARKQARVIEKESLQKAKGILSGMDVSLMQTARKSNTFLRRNIAAR